MNALNKRNYFDTTIYVYCIIFVKKMIDKIKVIEYTCN